MRHLLDSLAPWGLEIIQRIQLWETAWLTGVFQAITKIGDKEGYLLLFPLVYWCIHAGWGRRMAMLGMASLSVNTLLKIWIDTPRPSAASVKAMIKAGGSSFPSGHAQGPATLWGYLALRSRSWTWGIAIAVMVFLIGLSRIYLGVHFPQDILGGWGIALTLLGLFVWLEPKITPILQTLQIGVQLFLAVLVPLLFWALAPTSSTNSMICAAWLGWNVGLVGDHRWLHYSADGNWIQRLRRCLGLVLVVAVWLGLKQIFPAGLFWKFLRYGVIGFCVSFGVPYFLLRLGWASPEQQTQEA